MKTLIAAYDHKGRRISRPDDEISLDSKDVPVARAFLGLIDPNKADIDILIAAQKVGPRNPAAYGNILAGKLFNLAIASIPRGGRVIAGF